VSPPAEFERSFLAILLTYQKKAIGLAQKEIDLGGDAQALSPNRSSRSPRPRWTPSARRAPIDPRHDVSVMTRPALCG
jgi:hypothetical protein